MWGLRLLLFRFEMKSSKFVFEGLCGVKWGFLEFILRLVMFSWRFGLIGDEWGIMISFREDDLYADWGFVTANISSFIIFCFLVFIGEKEIAVEYKLLNLFDVLEDIFWLTDLVLFGIIYLFDCIELFLLVSLKLCHLSSGLHIGDIFLLFFRTVLGLIFIFICGVAKSLVYFILTLTSGELFFRTSFCLKIICLL